MHNSTAARSQTVTLTGPFLSNPTPTPAERELREVVGLLQRRLNAALDIAARAAHRAEVAEAELRDFETMNDFTVIEEVFVPVEVRVPIFVPPPLPRRVTR